MSFDLMLSSMDKSPEYELVIILTHGASVHIHAGNMMDTIVLLEVPGGMLMMMSYGLGCLLTMYCANFCNSSHRYSMCQFHTGSSWMMTDQNFCTKK